MKQFLFPALLLAGVGAASAASAATEVGTISAVDPTDAQVIYTDGETFTFPNGPLMEAVLSQYQPGDVVAIALNSAPDGSWSYGAIWPDNGQRGYAVP